MIEPGIFGEDMSFTEDDWMDTGAEDVEDDFGGFVGGIGEAPVDLDLPEHGAPSPVGVFDVQFACTQRQNCEFQALGVLDGHQVRFTACVKRGECVCAVNTPNDELAKTFVLSCFINTFAEDVAGRGF